MKKVFLFVSVVVFMFAVWRFKSPTTETTQAVAKTPRVSQAGKEVRAEAIPEVKKEVTPTLSKEKIEKEELTEARQAQFKKTEAIKKALEKSEKIEEEWLDRKGDFLRNTLRLSETVMTKMTDAREKATEIEDKLASLPAANPSEDKSIRRQMAQNRQRYYEELEKILGDDDWHNYQQFVDDYWKEKVKSDSQLHETLM